MQLPALPCTHLGSSYPEDPAEIRSHFAEALDGVTAARAPLTFDRPEFLILPHIDFRVNFELYAQTYLRLAMASVWPERILILGVGHQCPYEFSVVPFPMETPLGTLDGDLDAFDYWQSGCPFDLAHSPESFVGEHSIEFAAIWLETLRQRHFPKSRSRALPMLCGGLNDFLVQGEPPGQDHSITMLGERMAEWIEEYSTEPLLVIVSIDGCHVGPRFQHDFYAHPPARRSVMNWESALWRHCSHRSYEAFFDHLSRIGNMFYFDGSGALSLLIRHLDLSASIEETVCWHEDTDQSMVSFSCGSLEHA
jgi:predicted class III extradiol MEMO1 family dioxygenase